MDARTDFDAIDRQSPVPGQRFKVAVRGDKRLRLVDFGEDFVEKDWCTAGHAGVVLEGAFTLAFRAGGEQKLARGDTILIEAGQAQAHMAMLGADESARLLLFETVEQPPPV